MYFVLWITFCFTAAQVPFLSFSWASLNVSRHSPSSSCSISINVTADVIPDRWSKHRAKWALKYAQKCTHTLFCWGQMHRCSSQHPLLSAPDALVSVVYVCSCGRIYVILSCDFILWSYNFSDAAAAAVDVGLDWEGKRRRNQVITSMKAAKQQLFRLLLHNTI